MRELTTEEITKFASMPNVKKIAVENFLMSMGTDSRLATINSLLDSKLYNWNKETLKAIHDGIKLAMHE